MDNLRLKELEKLLDENEAKMDELLDPSKFVLNKQVEFLISENIRLRREIEELKRGDVKS